MTLCYVPSCMVQSFIKQLSKGRDIPLPSIPAPGCRVPSHKLSARPFTHGTTLPSGDPTACSSNVVVIDQEIGEDPELEVRHRNSQDEDVKSCPSLGQELSLVHHV